MVSKGSYGFNKGPMKSLTACSPNPEDAKVKAVNFYTNQFKMKIGKNSPQIYQYALILFPGEADEIVDDKRMNYQAFEIEKVISRERSRIELLAGVFINSGFNIWTTQQLEESFLITSRLMGKQVTLKIDHTTEFTVNTADIDKPNREDCISYQQVLNVITKQAMSETGLLQFGQRPRFFDSKNSILVPELEMQIWSGYKVCAYKYLSGCNLVIDSCARFMSTKTVLSRINDMYEEVVDGKFRGDTQRGLPHFQDAVRKQFTGSSVISNYGTKRTYIVQDINFELGPCNTFFTIKDGQNISVAKYFYKTYNLKVTDKRQPMLVVRNGGQTC